MINLEGKVCVVTGGSRGIGKSIAKKLASHKANIVINYTSNEESALKAKEEIEEYGVKSMIFKCDVSKSSEVEAMIESVVKEFGKVDILVNNAGITRDGLLMRMKEDDFDKVIDINLKGVFNCTKSVTKYMMKKRYGKIINISSVVGIIGNPGQANYCASKAGVIGLTKSSARELASRNINVNAIAPGFIDTDMTSVLNEDLKESMLKNIPQNRFGEPEDVANLVLFLASDMSSYITGQVINVDGGMVMQ
jgi:3-oxoacyl-[acyl-carrier protein] reductase